jgi:3-methylfumaryl-CoA hydratase
LSKLSRIKSIKPGDLLPERQFEPDNVQLFLYNSALWNAHRIHFDHPYATEVEGYPGLVIAGPLLGDWLTQSVIEWLGDDGKLASIEYSNRKASYIGETLRSGGKVLSSEQDTGTVELEMYIKNEADEVITPGVAVVRFAVT